jgi:hypothetical protein
MGAGAAGPLCRCADERSAWWRFPFLAAFSIAIHIFRAGASTQASSGTGVHQTPLGFPLFAAVTRASVNFCLPLLGRV